MTEHAPSRRTFLRGGAAVVMSPLLPSEKKTSATNIFASEQREFEWWMSCLTVFDETIAQQVLNLTDLPYQASVFHEIQSLRNALQYALTTIRVYAIESEDAAITIESRARDAIAVAHVAIEKFKAAASVRGSPLYKFMNTFSGNVEARNTRTKSYAGKA